MFFGSVGVRVHVLVAELLRDRLGGGDALVARLVREPRRRGDVADRPDAGHVGAAHRVGVDMALGGLHAERLEPDILGVRDDADRDDAVAEALLGRSCRRLVLIFAATPLASAVRLSTPAPVRIVSPCFGQALGELRADLGILDRHDAVEHLDHRHLGAEVGVEAGELDPDRARADDQQLGRHFGRGHRVAVGPDALAVGLGERQVARPRAGGDDDVLGGELGRLAVRAGDRQLAFAGELALAHHDRDLVLLHQVRDALVELLGDRAAARDDLGEVERRLLVAEAVGVGVLM